VLQTVGPAVDLLRLLQSLFGRAQQPEHDGHVRPPGDAGILPDGEPAGLLLTAAVRRNPPFQICPGGGEVPVIGRGQHHRRAGFRQQRRLGALLGEPQLLLGQSLHHQHLAPRVIYPSQASQHRKALRRRPEPPAQLLRAYIRPTDLGGGEASGGL
jgi:hypothetical protein